MNRCKIILTLIMLATAGMVFGQTKGGARKSAAKAASAKTAATKAVGAWVNFNGGELINKIAVDSKNVYVCMKYTKRLVAIDKTTGKMSEIKADHEISGVAVAADKCYYYVDREGIFGYDAATGNSEGPLFGFIPDDWYSPENLYASPDGRFLLCGDLLVDITEGRAISKPGSGSAINNLGGVYISSPEEWYAPLNQQKYQVSPLGSAVRQVYPDEVTGNAYYCTSEGLSETPIVPQPQSGLKKINTNFETEYTLALFITRDDEGNFVVSTNSKGIGFGGKSIEDPFRMEDKIDTGISVYGMKRYFTGGGDTYIVSDGNGNLIFGPDSSAYIFIYNPKGINGYADLKGKIVDFE